MRDNIVRRNGKLLAGMMAVLAISQGAAQTSIHLLDNMDYTAGQSIDGKSGSNGSTAWTTAWEYDSDNMPDAEATSPGLSNPYNPNASGNALTLTSEEMLTNDGYVFRDFGYTINDDYESAEFGFLISMNGNPQLSFAGISLFNGNSEVLFLGKPGNPSNGGYLGYQIPGSSAVTTGVTFASGTSYYMRLLIDFDPEGKDTGTLVIYSPSAIAAVWEGFDLGENFTFDRLRITRDAIFPPEVGVTFDAVELKAAVPEPGTALLLGIGLSCVLFLRKRTR